MPARADNPAAADVERAEALIAELGATLDAKERLLAGGVAGRLDPATANEQVAGALGDGRKSLAGLRDRVQAARAELGAGRLTPAASSRLVTSVGSEAITKAFQVAMKATALEVLALRRDHDEFGRRLREEHEDAKRAIAARRLDAAAEQRALEALAADLGGRERAHALDVEKRHQEATRHLLEDRRRLGAAAWRLSDYHAKRGRADQALAIERLVYATFEGNLAARGAEFHSARLGASSLRNSELDYFMFFPGSPSRLAITARFDPSVSRLLKMDAEFLAEPVEALEQPDGLAPVSASGSELEQACRMLSERSVALFEAQARLKAAFEELRAASSSVPRPSDLPDPIALRSRLNEIRVERMERTERARQRADARAALRRAEQDLELADQRLAEARKGIMVSRTDGSLARERDRKVEPASERMSRLRQQLSDHRRIVEDDTVAEYQRTATRTTTIPRLEGEIAALEQVMATATPAETAEQARAALALEQARGAAEHLPPPEAVDDPALDWMREKAAYDRIAAWAASALGMTMPPFAAEPEDDEAQANARALGDVDERARAQGMAETARLAQARAEITMAGEDVRLLSHSVAGLRASALLLAETTLEGLGTPPGDPVFQRLSELQKAAEETKKFMEKYDRALEIFGGALKHLPDDPRAKALLADTRSNVSLIARTFGKVSQNAERLTLLETIEQQLSDERTALQGMASVLQLAKQGTEFVPLAGPLVARVLDTYAQQMVAINAEALRIQAAVLEQDVAVLSQHAPPERHLYTSSELSSLRIGNEAAVDRTKRMLQVRRLLALVGARDVSTARDLPLKRG